MSIIKYYRASEERIQAFLRRLLVSNLLNRPLNAIAARLHRWQARVSRQRRNSWILMLLFSLLLYGLYTLYPLIDYLWNR